MNDELMNDFLEESYDLIEKIKFAINSWNNQDKQEQLNSVYRWVHTIKGGASVFSLESTTRIAHDLETFLGNLRKDNNDVPVDVLKKISNDVNAIEASLRGENPEALQEVSAPVSEPVQAKFHSEFFQDFVEDSFDLLRDMAAGGFLFFEVFIPGKNAGKIIEKIEEFNILSVQTEMKEEGVAALFSLSSDPSQKVNAEKLIKAYKGHWIEQTQEEIPVTSEAEKVVSIVPAKATSPVTPSAPQEVLRVPLNTINGILDHIWELFLARNQMSHFFKANKELFKDNHAFIQQFESFDNVLERNIHELESKTMSLRLNPVKKIFDRMDKVVSEYCHQTGKKINFVTKGDGIDLDKKVLDQLNEPLIHLIRNAIDHGIEGREDRIKSNKAEVGTVELSAQIQGNEVILIVKDDGKGIDPQKILASARKKNIETAHLTTEQEILNLIFAPGFSTAENVTDVSGRGVGMDAVRTSIRELGGHLSIETEVDSGTSFKINLPLTMSVSKSLVVKIRGLEYAIPSKSIIFVEKISVHNLKHNGHDEYYDFNGNLIECLSLKDLLPDYRTEPELPEIYTHVCVTNIENREVAFRVDEIAQTLNLVMKPLPQGTEKHPLLAGVSIMPGGNPVFVLNVHECLKKLQEKRGHDKRRA